MKIHKFNANVQKVKRHLKQDSGKQIRKLTTSLCVFIIIVGIVYFSYAKFEEGNVFHLTDGVVGEFFNGDYSQYLAQCNSGIAECIKSAPHKDRENVISDNTVDNNLRYVGSNPNNYILFNNELWRIIGVMNNVEDESGNRASRVKLIKASSLGQYSWDTSTSSINNGNGINQWGESGSYEGADLMRELNTDYLGNITVGTDGYWYNGSKDTKTATMPASLNIVAADMIDTVKWYSATNSGFNREFSSMYNYERGNISGKSCSLGASGDGCSDEVVRTTDWIGKVAVIYPTDYYLATSGGEDCVSAPDYGDACKNNNWLYSISQWTITPGYYQQFASDVLTIEDSGVYSNYTAFKVYDIYPTLYLKQNINIIGGTGTSNDPYRLNVEGFGYTGDVQTYTVAKSGTYKLETWGAQGGGITSIPGGAGGYSTGEINLSKNTDLYVVVGEAGNYGNSTGGYNGGGNGTTHSGSGGGATHIAINNNLGQLKEYGSNKSDILIVAGGGGGASDASNYTCSCQVASGTPGGGLSAPQANYDSCSHTYSSLPTGGNQENGGQAVSLNQGTGTHGSFGLGGNAASAYNVVGGGGGGYYGGAGGSVGGNCNIFSGTGGSGYISTSLNNAQTTVGDQSSGNFGNGYVKITYLGN